MVAAPSFDLVELMVSPHGGSSGNLAFPGQMRRPMEELQPLLKEREAPAGSCADRSGWSSSTLRTL